MFTQELHGATSQKTTFFLVTSVKLSNLTWSLLVFMTDKLFGHVIFHKEGVSEEDRKAGSALN
jgi:hypothetical protein